MIYSCLAFRIQPTSRCPEFTTVLSISYCFYYTTRSTKLKGVYSFHLALCGQNRVRCVSSTILAISISHLHILSTNFRRCVGWKIPKFEFFANFFQFTPLALSCVDVMWMFKVDSSSKLQFCIFVIFFFNCTFSLSLCGGIKDKFDCFLL